MGARNSTLSPGSSVNISNFVRLFIVSQTELPNILRELLLAKEPPAFLDGHIRNNTYLSNTLRAFELGVIATVRTKQYADFDVALMYKIIRNLNLVPPPTQDTEELYLRQLEDLVERETIMQSNISAVSNSVDELRQQNQINKDIEEWKFKDKKFVPTRASAYVASHLNKKSCVTLTGSPGWNHSVNVRNDKGVTPLYIACEKGYAEIVEELLESNADVNIGMEDEKHRLSPLSQATKMNHFDIVRKLLKKTPDVNFSGTDRYTALLFACQANSTEIARLLIINKADICARTNIGATALHLAVGNGNIEITQLLLKHNANYNSRIDAKEFICFK
ncbi:unnamed protein product [Mytilus edulis]|uniref:Ankyrin repeat protein n=1 Tax=Mytilus edulis TaxID=6550 RepID=A0A8S3T9X6_MYTED|nr:unnamed protein product [Mytilus edulis]